VEKWENGIAIEGPEHHLEFLYPYLLKLVKSSGISEEFGTWTGVKWANENWLNLYFMFGQSLKSMLELLEHKLRRDIVTFCDLKLSEKAVLSVVDHDEPLVVRILDLPYKLSKNGTVEFPPIILAPLSLTFH